MSPKSESLTDAWMDGGTDQRTYKRSHSVAASLLKSKNIYVVVMGLARAALT